jgi:hypothetical protein
VEVGDNEGTDCLLQRELLCPQNEIPEFTYYRSWVANQYVPALRLANRASVEQANNGPNSLYIILHLENSIPSQEILDQVHIYLSISFVDLQNYIPLRTEYFIEPLTYYVNGFFVCQLWT